MLSKNLKKQCYVWFQYANLASWHQMMISSETTRLFRYPIGMLGTILERQKVMLLVFESHRNTLFNLGNTLSTSVDLRVDQNAWKYGYCGDISPRVVLDDEFLWSIFFRNSKKWTISFLTHYQPCSYDVYIFFYTLRHMCSKILKIRRFVSFLYNNLTSCLIYIRNICIFRYRYSKFFEVVNFFVN